MIDKPHFKLSRRGYEPEEVDSFIESQNRTMQAAKKDAAERSVELTKLNAALTDLRGQLGQQSRVMAELRRQSSPTSAQTFGDLGQRIGQILVLADEEASEMRRRATAEADEIRERTNRAAAELKATTNTYAEQVRSRADEESARIIAQANHEAEAIVAEAQSVTAAQRQEAAQEAAETKAEAQRILEAAESQADQIVSEARAQASRVREESERELAAATAHRDSITAQLANVRTMLSTLDDGALADALGNQRTASPQSSPSAPDEQQQSAARDASQSDGPDQTQQQEQDAPADEEEQSATQHGQEGPNGDISRKGEGEQSNADAAHDGGDDPDGPSASSSREQGTHRMEASAN